MPALLSRSLLGVAVVLTLALTPAIAPAAYPGANGVVAFTSTEDGGGQHIFVTAAGGIRDLTGVRSTAVETEPKFSPDGRKILFTRGDPGHLPNDEIFVMKADGTGRIQLTNTAQGNSDATWSPDGHYVAFVSNRDSEIPNIFVMRADGSHVRQITHDNAYKSELAWSPRGDSIAFVRVRAGGGDREIYSIRPDGTGLKDLTNDPRNDDLQPAFSPDGGRIVYSGPHHLTGSVGGDLWIMNADGSGQHQLQHEGNGYSDGAYPAWSPDGTMIAFAANNGSGYYHLWSVPVSGGQNTGLVENQIPGGNPGDEETDWQPRTGGPGSPSTMITSVSIAASSRSASVRFRATGRVTRYLCELVRGDGDAFFAPCKSPRRYAHLRSGRYTFEVTAIGPRGVDPTPAIRSFRIR